MLRARDSQRSRVYTADRGLIPSLTPLSLRGCQDIVDDLAFAYPIMYSAWDGRAPQVKDGRGRRRACYDPAEHTISLPVWSRKISVVCHEAAHAVVRNMITKDRQLVAWHGPEFARVYLDMMRHVAGEYAPRLFERMKEAKVKLAPVELAASVRKY